MRRRISIRKEDRIWHLRCQGYTYDSIARITNTSPHALTKVLRRVRRRPPVEQDPVRRGRLRGWLDDDQINDIRVRYRRGEKLASIANDYWMQPSSICSIGRRRSYVEPAEDQSDRYPFSFKNRLRAA